MRGRLTAAGSLEVLDLALDDAASAQQAKLDVFDPVKPLILTGQLVITGDNPRLSYTDKAMTLETYIFTTDNGTEYRLLLWYNPYAPPEYRTLRKMIYGFEPGFWALSNKWVRVIGWQNHELGKQDPAWYRGKPSRILVDVQRIEEIPPPQ